MFRGSLSLFIFIFLPLHPFYLPTPPPPVVPRPSSSMLHLDSLSPIFASVFTRVFPSTKARGWGGKKKNEEKKPATSLYFNHLLDQSTDRYGNTAELLFVLIPTVIAVIRGQTYGGYCAIVVCRLEISYINWIFVYARVITARTDDHRFVHS